MTYKRLRNLIALIGVMAALVPTFLFYTTGTYYGAGFSYLTTTVACLCFMGASAVQMADNKKRGLPISGPLLPLIGFACLLGYIWIFMAH